MAVHDAKFTAEGVVFAGCSSDGDGGAIVAVASTVLVNNSTLDGSSALGSGGAVALTGGTLEVAGSSFVGVDAAKSGGAIYAVDAPVVIDACNFTDVTASRPAHIRDRSSRSRRAAKRTGCRGEGATAARAPCI